MSSRFAKLSLAVILAGSFFSGPARAEVVTATIQTPPPAETGYFKLGTTKNPAGHEINLNSRSLLFDGQPVFPVMGEIHYSRVPAAEWREELLKMKAGGVTIVATYVFWIHHEEIEGQWDWSGQRDLKKFVQTCGDLGLKVIVRCGPWCHGEVRNGGFPDWVQAHKDWKLRSTDTNFLAATKILYDQISQQLRGELWKDGGPVIGIQVDNEFGGSPNYLMALKKLAIEAGLDVPYYIKTGWPPLKVPVPLGELIPLFGAYPDGFWSRGLKAMEGETWTRFAFQIIRTDTGIGNDTLKMEPGKDTAGTDKYPHLTCEIGGGMPASYHRRMNYDPRDVEANVLTQLGDGSDLLGYYMYHGGQNPEGKLSTLQESTATGYANDLPVKSYDFNAPLGEFGQINPQYYWLRRLHLFLHDFGAPLTQMPTTLSDVEPKNKNDLTTLRWAVRSDGTSGYVFVCNYQRLQPLPAKPDVQFKLTLPGGELVFPQKPVTIPADGFFFWPFNLDLGGAKLIYATAQPVCKIEVGDTQTFFFAETPKVKAEFVFDTNTLASKEAKFKDLKPGHEPVISLLSRTGKKIQILLLSDSDSQKLLKDKIAGQECVILSHQNIGVENDRITRFDGYDVGLKAEIFPVPEPYSRYCKIADSFAKKPDGIFHWLFYLHDGVMPLPPSVHVSAIKPAGPARVVPLSSKTHLAAAPEDADFTNAAVWKITLPANWNAEHQLGTAKSTETNEPGRSPALQGNPLLRIHYIGDVARLTLNGKLIADNFYCGREFDLGLQRYAPEIFTGDLRLEILPLRKDAPIFIEPKDRPDFGTHESLVKLQSAEIVIPAESAN